MLGYPSPKEVIFHRDVTGHFYEALINSSFNLKNSERMANVISTLKRFQIKGKRSFLSSVQTSLLNSLVLTYSVFLAHA